MQSDISGIPQDVISLAQSFLGLVVYIVIIGLSLGLSLIPERRGKMNSRIGF